jgi:hypothetical protein
MGTIGIEALDAGWSIIFPLSKRIFRAGCSAWDVTALARLEILRRTAGRELTFDQYRAESDPGSPFPVQKQVVFSHHTKSRKHGGIFQIHPSFFHVVGQRLCTNPISPQ